MNESDLSVKIPELKVTKLEDFPLGLLSYIKNNPEFRELLNSNDYKKLYSYISDVSIVTGQLTRLLYSLGFDPLRDLTFVPRNFLYGQNCPPIYVTVPDNIEYLHVYSFAKCDLTTISLPATLRYIDRFAFYDTPYLERIEFRGTKEQWKKVRKIPDWISGASITNVGKIICTDGKIKL